MIEYTTADNINLSLIKYLNSKLIQVMNDDVLVTATHKDKQHIISWANNNLHKAMTIMDHGKVIMVLIHNSQAAILKLSFPDS